MALREILTAFGFEVDDSALKKGQASAEGFKNTLQEIGKALVGGELVRGFGELVSSTIESASQLGDMSKRLGLTTSDLQFFQFAARTSGLSADEMAHSMSLLNRTLGEAATGGKEQQKSFTDLGLSFKDANGRIKTSADLLPEIADKVNALGSQAEKTAAVTKLFGREGAALLPLFADGSKGIEEARKQFKSLGLEIDDNFITSAKEAGDQMETFKIQTDVLKTQLVAAFLPSLKDATEFLLKMGKGAQDLAKNTNIVKIAMAGLALLAGGAAIGAINGLLRAVGLLDAEMSILDGEVLLPVAALALLILVIEDLYTLFTGGDSLIGRFIDKLFGVGASKKFVLEVKQEVERLWIQFKQILPPLEEIGRKLVDAFKLALPYILEFEKGGLISFVYWLKMIVNGVSILITILGYLISYGKIVFGAVSAEVKFAGTVLKGLGAIIDTFVIKPLMFVIGLAEKVAAAISKVTGGAQALSGAGAGGQSGGFLSSAASLGKSALGIGGDKNASVSQNNQTTIHVNGADQPQSVAAKVANAVSDTFETQKRNALNAIGSIF